MSFQCNKCGECCWQLKRSPLYKVLDRGDDVCKYLSSNLCSIYEKRPLLCRVDESYDVLLKGTMSIINSTMWFVIN